MRATGKRTPPEVVPFRSVALHGLIRDQLGQKMSKSKGNAVDPLELIDRYGADALRFTLSRGANPAVDIPLGEEWVQASRNFCNKLWNAARFALLNGATVDRPIPPAEQLSAADRWILSRLQTTVAQVDAHYEDYQFARATEALFHFAWDEVCDWYVELAKTPLSSGGAEAETTQAVLGYVLDVLLRLLHPIVPYVTETLWTALTHQESLVISEWPAADVSRYDAAAEAEIGSMQRLVTEVRRFRSEQGLRPTQRMAARLLGLHEAGLAGHEAAVRALLRLSDATEAFAPTATLPVGGVRIELDLSGAIDVAAERKRLERDLAAARKELAQVDAKLGNEQFLSKAPQQVVVKIRDRQATATVDVARLEAQLADLPAS
jgi:valyl-tRNA synthetase